MARRGRTGLGVAVDKKTQAAGSGLGSVLCAPRGILRAPLGRTLTCTSALGEWETPGAAPGSYLLWCLWHPGPDAGFAPWPWGLHPAVARENEDK